MPTTPHDRQLADAVAAAEARGDAAGALAVIERDQANRQHHDLWHPERVAGLVQQVALGEVLPGWVTSRWLLAQAARSTAAGNRDRALDAALLVGEAVGGGVARYVAAASSRERLTMTDHDWAWRQVLLHELGGLAAFLDDVADPALAARADRVAEWARAPMGGYRFLGSTPRTTAWLDLGTDARVETDNIGSASLVEPGDCAVGRLVATTGRPVFTCAPLPVRADLAQAVAADPDEWLAPVALGCRRPARLGECLVTAVPPHRLVSDVPRALVYAVAHEAAALDVHDCGPEPMREHCVALVRLAARHPEVLDLVEADPWPVVSSLLLEPAVLLALTAHVAPEDDAAYAALAARLPEPAAAVCRALARRERLAA